ncbi:hypothetical protein DIPPA_19641 [Diplonema papillatum]|nr:hypothetical protein DIPPA_19641 [Diplonema papillatum]
MDAALLEEKLTPAPSISRMGKMAHSSMHTDVLVRNGVAALQKRMRKEKKAAFSLADIVDPSQLDTFGTAVPGQDSGRKKEMSSSPRGHLELASKLNGLFEGERISAFNKKMHLADRPPAPPAPEDPKPRAASPPPANPQAAKPPAQPLSPVRQRAAHGRARPAAEQPSACFLTVNRFSEPSHLKTPPVGHYRPKFSVVDVSSRCVTFRHPEHEKHYDRSGWVMTSPTYAPRQGPEPAVPAPPPEDFMLSKNNGTASDPAQTSSNLVPVPPPPAGDKAGGRGSDYAAWAAKRQPNAASQKGTSAFTSGVKIAALSPTKAPVPDRTYHPYDESARGAKPEVRPVFLDWSRNTSRGHPIIFKGYSERSEAPDVIYDANKGGALGNKGGTKFGDQVSRAKAATDAQQMASRTGRQINAAGTGSDLHQYPASHIMYNSSSDKLRYQAAEPANFNRSIGRDQRPTEMQRPKATLDPVHHYETSKPRYSLCVRLVGETEEVISG